MQSRFISYLDLMCCGFGGALLMFLIVASARERRESAEPMLVVRCRAEGTEQGDLPASGGELGIEYRRVGSKNWIRANGPPNDEDLTSASDAGPAGEKWVFLPRTAPHQPAEAVLICRYPRAGEWEFRAYLADYPTDSDTSDARISVLFEFLGAVQKQFPPNLLITPGTTTEAVTIEIGSTQ